MLVHIYLKRHLLSRVELERNVFDHLPNQVTAHRSQLAVRNAWKALDDAVVPILTFCQSKGGNSSILDGKILIILSIADEGYRWWQQLTNSVDPGATSDVATAARVPGTTVV